MSLDLTITALQIDSMAAELKNRNNDKFRRIDTAVETVGNFDLDAYQAKHEESRSTLLWNVPSFTGDPKESFTVPPIPDDFCIVAVDGSHIDIDRHLSARCFLINTGTVYLRYGSEPDAELSNQPRLYADEDELVIKGNVTPFRQVNIDGALLGAKRAVEEIKALVHALHKTPNDVPTVGLVDGTLVMFGLRNYDDFVVRELVDNGFVSALEELREMASQRQLAVASYISLPRSQEVANALRLQACPFYVASCDQNCGQIPARERACDQAVGGIMDREIFLKLLDKGQRSSVFVSNNIIVSKNYQGHGIHFFYVNTGEEIGRVEVPSWIAENEDSLDLVHSLIVDQCQRGPGYPVALMEAHEQAVVTGVDRRYFVELVEQALFDQHLPTFSSEKNISKRQKWI